VKSLDWVGYCDILLAFGGETAKGCSWAQSCGKVTPRREAWSSLVETNISRQHPNPSNSLELHLPNSQIICLPSKMAGISSADPMLLGDTPEPSISEVVRKFKLSPNVGHKMAALRDYSVNPRLRYRTIKSVNGPLVVVDNVKGPRYSEIVQIQPREGPPRTGQVLEISGRRAVVQVSLGLHLSCVQ